MSGKPLVSVITPMCNASEFVSETVSSVQAQTYDNWEMLVVDNHSTDNSREIVLGFSAQDPRVKLMACEYNSGSPARPRNVGIKNAAGEYICFLDADDLWLKDKLEKQVSFMEAHPDVFLLYGRYRIMKNGSLLDVRVEPPLKKMKAGMIFDELFLADNFIPCLTVMFRNRKEEGYLFDEDPGSMEDLDLWLRIARREKAGFMDEPSAIYRVHGKSTTASIKVFFRKYSKLLKKWRGEVSAWKMFLRYTLLVWHMAVMILRKIKG